MDNSAKYLDGLQLPVRNQDPSSTTLRGISIYLLPSLGFFLLVSILGIPFRGLTWPSSSSSLPPSYSPLASSSAQFASYIQSLEEPQCMDKFEFSKSSSQALSLTEGRSLSIFQKLDRHTHGQPSHTPHVFGEITLEPTTSPSALFEIEIASNVEAGLGAVDVRFESQGQAIKVLTPLGVARPQVCIRINIRVRVPTVGSRADHFLVDADTLAVRVAGGLRLDVQQRAALSTAVGEIGLPAGENGHGLAAREMEIASAAGDVSGWLPLYDSLQIKTLSGNVRVLVTPQEDAASVAALEVSSVSGDVSVTEPLDAEIPLRRYFAAVSSTSGNVEAEVAFAEVGLDSQSGNIKARLLPVLEPQQKLQTSTKSGRSSVAVMEPRGAELSLKSIHHSISGDLEIIYPDSWEGTFSMATVSGRQTVRGEGVTWNRGSGWFPKIEGAKGSGSSQMTMDGVTGEQVLKIGA